MAPEFEVEAAVKLAVRDEEVIVRRKSPAACRVVG